MKRKMPKRNPESDTFGVPVNHEGKKRASTRQGTAAKKATACSQFWQAASGSDSWKSVPRSRMLIKNEDAASRIRLRIPPNHPAKGHAGVGRCGPKCAVNSRGRYKPSAQHHLRSLSHEPGDSWE